MSIVITGHKGFIGSHMLKFLRDRGEHSIIIATDHDLRSLADTIDLFSGAEYVFHFAADMGGVGYFSEHQYNPFINNMIIDLNVIRACEVCGIKRLFYPSSACAYSPSTKPLKESMLEKSYDPDKLYGWEKLSILKLAEHAPFEIRVGVLHTIFGEGQTWEGKKAKFPPQLAFKALRARVTGKLEIWGDGEQTRTFLHIDDAIKMIYEVMFSKNYYGAVNISSSEEVTINQCVEYVCKYLDINPQVIHNLEAPTGTKTRGADMTKFHKHYSYQQKITTEEGFKKLVDWLRDECLD